MEPESPARDRRWLTALRSPRVTVRLRGGALIRRTKPFSGLRKPAPCHVLFCIFSNTITVNATGREQQLESGDLFWVSPGVEFGMFGNDASYPTRFIGMGIEVLRGEKPVAAPRNLCIVRGSEKLQQMANLILLEHRSPSKAREAILRAALETITFLTAEEESHHRAVEGGLPDRDRQRVIAAFRESLPGRITPAELAGVTAFSPDYFSRLFRRTFGVAPKSWILQQRLRQAAERLAETNEPVSRIADHFGFSDVYNFSRQFKAEHGVSPKIWRRRAGILSFYD